MIGFESRRSHGRWVREVGSMRVVLLLLVSMLTGNLSCDQSPVEKNRTVRVRGRVQPGTELVKMSNPGGMADRSASVGPDGRYEFTWTGTDLTGMFGEREFTITILSGGGSVRTDEFHVRGDMELPPLYVWNPSVSARKTEDGAVLIEYSALAGADYQEAEKYEVELRYEVVEVTMVGGEETGRRNAPRSTRLVGDERGAKIPAAEARRLFAGLATGEVEVRVSAHGGGSSVNLTYDTRWCASVRLPSWE